MIKKLALLIAIFFISVSVGYAQPPSGSGHQTKSAGTSEMLELGTFSNSLGATVTEGLVSMGSRDYRTLGLESIWSDTATAWSTKGTLGAGTYVFDKITGHSCDAATDKITAVGHDWVEPEGFVVNGVSECGLSETVTYYVCNVSGDTFEVDTASNCAGAPIALVDDVSSQVLYKAIMVNGDEFYGLHFYTETAGPHTGGNLYGMRNFLSPSGRGGAGTLDIAYAAKMGLELYGSRGDTTLSEAGALNLQLDSASDSNDWTVTDMALLRTNDRIQSGWTSGGATASGTKWGHIDINDFSEWSGWVQTQYGLWIDNIGNNNNGTAFSGHTCTNAGDTINKTSHGLSNGQLITISADECDLEAGYVYVVCNANTNDFQIDDQITCGGDCSTCASLHAITADVDPSSATITPQSKNYGLVMSGTNSNGIDYGSSIAFGSEQEIRLGYLEATPTGDTVNTLVALARPNETTAFATYVERMPVNVGGAISGFESLVIDQDTGASGGNLVAGDFTIRHLGNTSTSMVMSGVKSLVSMQGGNSAAYSALYGNEAQVTLGTLGDENDYTVTDMAIYNASVSFGNQSTSDLTVTDISMFRAKAPAYAKNATFAVTNHNGLLVETATAPIDNGTITNEYGVRIEDLNSGATNKFGVMLEDGSDGVYFGGTSGQSITGTTTELKVGDVFYANGYAVASLPGTCVAGAITRATDSDDCSAGSGNGSLCACNNAGNGWVLLLNY